MENLGKTIAFLLLMGCSVLLQLLLAYIILSISTLYGVSFISQLTFTQVFGTLIIISLVRYRKTKTEEKDLGEVFLEGSVGLLTNLFLYLFVWGFAFLTYYMIF